MKGNGKYYGAILDGDEMLVVTREKERQEAIDFYKTGKVAGENVAILQEMDTAGLMETGNSTLGKIELVFIQDDKGRMKVGFSGDSKTGFLGGNALGDLLESATKVAKKHLK